MEIKGKKTWDILEIHSSQEEGNVKVLKRVAGWLKIPDKLYFQ